MRRPFSDLRRLADGLRRASDDLRRQKPGCDGHLSTCDDHFPTCDAKNPDLLDKMTVCDGLFEFGDGQKATVKANWQGCGRGTLKEKLKPYLQTGEWSE